MRKGLCVVFAVLCLLSVYVFGACAQGKTTVKKDPFTGTTSAHLSNLQLDVEGFMGGALRADVIAFEKEDGSKTYTMSLLYANLSGIGLDKAYFLVDGKRHSFEGKTSFDVVSGGGVHESLVFVVDKAFLEEIGNAKTVKVKVTGSKGEAVGSLRGSLIVSIKEFVDSLDGGLKEEKPLDPDG